MGGDIAKAQVMWATKREARPAGASSLRYAYTRNALALPPRGLCGDGVGEVSNRDMSKTN